MLPKWIRLRKSIGTLKRSTVGAILEANIVTMRVVAVAVVEGLHVDFCHPMQKIELFAVRQKLDKQS